MGRKIFGIFVCMLFLLLVIPICHSQEVGNPNAIDTESFVHVVITGTGKVFLLGSNFIAGIGTCVALIVNLESDGHIEINKLFDPSDTIELEGSNTILLIGFIGYYRHVSGINLNGASVLAVW